MRINIIAILIILVWLPFSIPLIFIGSLVRLVLASVLYGYNFTDEGLLFLAKALYNKQTHQKEQGG